MSKAEIRVSTSIHHQMGSFSLGLLLTTPVVVNSAQLPVHPEDKSFFPLVLEGWLWVVSMPADPSSLFAWHLSLFCLPVSVPGKLLALGMLCFFFTIGKLLHSVQGNQLDSKRSCKDNASALLSSCSLAEDIVQDIANDEQINQTPSVKNLRTQPRIYT